MDLLQLCAQKYAELCYYTYDCTIARKNTAIDLHFTLIGAPRAKKSSLGWKLFLSSIL